jgi:hypothetical protein
MAVVDPESFEPWHQYSLHHRSARGMGGTKDPAINDSTNLLLLCGTGTTECHGRVEHDPTWATEHGYRVPSWEDPATVSVTHYSRGWILLT